MDGAPFKGGMIMVTWEALNAMFTFGLLLVAVIALFIGNNNK